MDIIECTIKYISELQMSLFWAQAFSSIGKVWALFTMSAYCRLAILDFSICNPCFLIMFFFTVWLWHLKIIKKVNKTMESYIATLPALGLKLRLVRTNPHIEPQGHNDIYELFRCKRLNKDIQFHVHFFANVSRRYTWTTHSKISVSILWNIEINKYLRTPLR